MAKGPESTKQFLPAIDAAAFLGVNLDTFARRIAPTLTPVAGKRHRVYARKDLEAWRASAGQKAR